MEIKLSREEKKKQFMKKFGSTSDENFPNENIPLGDFWQWIEDNFMQLSSPLITSGKVIILNDIKKSIEDLPDPSTMPYEHNVALKRILTMLGSLIKVK